MKKWIAVEINYTSSLEKVVCEADDQSIIMDKATEFIKRNPESILYIAEVHFKMLSRISVIDFEKCEFE